MSAKIDYANMSLQDALDLAILIEEEARDRYSEFVDQMALHHTEEAARFFREMIDNEAKHEMELKARRISLFGDAPSAVRRSMLWDVEAPDYDQTRAFMTARQAMQVALRSEIKAYQFFEEALPFIANEDVRALFQELREEELYHQQLVNRELGKLPADPDIDPGTFEDEPTAQ